MKWLIEGAAPRMPRTTPKKGKPPRNRATNRKKCARNGAFADKRATNRKKCAASARAAARPRVQAAARGVAAHACGSRTRGRPQVVASRNPRPAARNLRQSPPAGCGHNPDARRRSGEAPTRQRGDLWRFRKANPQVDEPWESGSMGIPAHRPLTAGVSVGRERFRPHRSELALEWGRRRGRVAHSPAVRARRPHASSSLPPRRAPAARRPHGGFSPADWQ